MATARQRLVSKDEFVDDDTTKKIRRNVAPPEENIPDPQLRAPPARKKITFSEPPTTATKSRPHAAGFAGTGEDDSFRLAADSLPTSAQRQQKLEATHKRKRKPKPKTRRRSCCQRMIILPWNKLYKIWWGFTVFCANITLFYETYEISFGRSAFSTLQFWETQQQQQHFLLWRDVSTMISFVLGIVFAIDLILNFFVAYFEEGTDVLVTEPRRIALHYFYHPCFWMELLGLLPLYYTSLVLFQVLSQPEQSDLSQSNNWVPYLGLIRLVRLLRFHRVWALFQRLQFSTHVNLMWVTLVRNFAIILIWSHLAACVFFFLARQNNFQDQTWIGPLITDLNPYQRYITSLYWSVVTFTTVGYGDFSPVNDLEQLFGIIYMLLNIILQSWIIGSITLLVVKNDEKTGLYRDTLESLQQYSILNRFDHAFQKRLKTQLQLDFNNRDIADEQVLQHFPTEVRRKVLQRLYLSFLLETKLVRGIRQQFVNDFLASCRVEIFGPDEYLLRHNSISSDLYLLVGGVVELQSFRMAQGTTTQNPNDNNNNNHHRNQQDDATTNNDSNEPNTTSTVPTMASKRLLEPGDFLNEIGFFTDSPQLFTVRTVTVCKTLSMSRSAYKEIADNHPGSIAKILQNLFDKAEAKLNALDIEQDIDHDDFDEEPGEEDEEHQHNQHENATNDNASGTETSSPTAGATNNNNDGTYDFAIGEDFEQVFKLVRSREIMSSITALVRMHMNKHQDDLTSRFLSAASRDDTETISLMCDQGFDPNSTDYDYRTALMLASAKGNLDVVSKLLEYGANANLVDMHGSSALFAAVQNGHDTTMDELLKKGGAKLCLHDNNSHGNNNTPATKHQEASVLCQAVFDSDMYRLRRLLRANIDPNATDYDKRSAVHIAASEGNLVALKILVEEFGADITLKDRWNNTPLEEARIVNSGPTLEYLQTRQH